MKKVLLIICLLSSFLLLCACGKDEGLVGIWYYEGSPSIYYTFNKDKSCSYTYGETVSICTYEDEGTRVTIHYEGTSTAKQFEYTITKDTLTIKDSYGSNVVYTKK